MRNRDEGPPVSGRDNGDELDSVPTADYPSPSFAGITQLVECDLAKVDVAGSSPVARSK
jgi:hypothetical protein